MELEHQADVDERAVEDVADLEVVFILLVTEFEIVVTDAKPDVLERQVFERDKSVDELGLQLVIREPEILGVAAQVETTPEMAPDADSKTSPLRLTFA